MEHPRQWYQRSWAFKVDATTGFASSVYQEPLADNARIEPSTDALVLTERKTLSKRTTRDGIFEAARNQAQRYAGGLLPGNELTHYPCAILV